MRETKAGGARESEREVETERTRKKVNSREAGVRHQSGGEML